MKGLLIGGTGGIGGSLLEVVKADSAVSQVMVSHRPSASVPESDGRVIWFELDLASEHSIARAREKIVSLFDVLDFVICASGMLHDDDTVPEKRLSQVTSDSLIRLYQVNAAGPLALLAGLEASLKRARQPKVALLSAQVGSIADNETGGWYGYRMSKAALNMSVKCLAVEADRWRNDPVVFAVHPGTTLTKLSSPFVQKRKAPVRAPEESARHIYELLTRAGPEEHGGFFTAQGDLLPW